MQRGQHQEVCAGTNTRDALQTRDRSDL